LKVTLYKSTSPVTAANRVEHNEEY